MGGRVALIVVTLCTLACAGGETSRAPSPPVPAAPAEPDPSLLERMPAECAEVLRAVAEMDAKIDAADNAGGTQIAIAASNRFGPYLDLDPRPPEVQAVADPLVLRISYFQAWAGIAQAREAIAASNSAEARSGLQTAQEALERLVGDFAATAEVKKLKQDLARAQKEIDPQIEQLRQGDEVEARFCQVLEQHAKLYREAPNDLKRSALRAARAKALLAAVPGGRVLRWRGTIKTLTTTGQGKAVVELTLPCGDFGMGTWNNELSDIGYGSLIPIDSPSFQSLSNMAPGTEVRVDGKLLNDLDGLDGFGEVSLTEQGSLTGGFFLIRMY